MFRVNDLKLKFLLEKDNGRAFNRHFMYNLLFSAKLEFPPVVRAINEWSSDKAVWNAIGILTLSGRDDAHNYIYRELVSRIDRVESHFSKNAIRYPRERMRRIEHILRALDHFGSPVFLSLLSYAYTCFVDANKNVDTWSLRRRVVIEFTPVVCDLCTELEVAYSTQQKKEDYALQLLVDMVFKRDHFISTYAFITLAKICLHFPRRRGRLFPVVTYLSDRIDAHVEAGVGMTRIALIINKQKICESYLERVIEECYDEISD